jgi:hypothetical protein
VKLAGVILLVLVIGAYVLLEANKRLDARDSNPDKTLATFVSNCRKQVEVDLAFGKKRKHCTEQFQNETTKLFAVQWFKNDFIVLASNVQTVAIDDSRAKKIELLSAK